MISDLNNTRCLKYYDYHLLSRTTSKIHSWQTRRRLLLVLCYFDRNQSMTFLCCSISIWHGLTNLITVLENIFYFIVASKDLKPTLVLVLSTNHRKRKLTFCSRLMETFRNSASWFDENESNPLHQDIHWANFDFNFSLSFVVEPIGIICLLSTSFSCILTIGLTGSLWFHFCFHCRRCAREHNSLFTVLVLTTGAQLRYSQCSPSVFRSNFS